MNDTTTTAEHRRYEHAVAETIDRVHQLPDADQALIHAAFADGPGHITAPAPPASAAAAQPAPAIR